MVNLRFASGALGNVEVSRNAFYGYDIRTEVLGSEGAVTIGAHQNTPVVLLTRNGAQHDTVSYLLERFGDAYFNRARPHQGIRQQLPEPNISSLSSHQAGDKVIAVPRVGGLHHDYQRVA
jgi:predicted dehydrogenase